MSLELIQAALKEVHYPGYTRDIVSFGLVEHCSFDAKTAHVVVRLSVQTNQAQVPSLLKQSLEAKLKGLSCVATTEVSIHVKSQSSQTTKRPEALQGVKTIIAISSGKGGVGKSTVAVNLACALSHLLQKQGRSNKVGLVDCDLYGPSIPLMLGLEGALQMQGSALLPMEKFNLKTMSMGLLVDGETPVAWRGPMVSKAIRQFASEVLWGELDVLLADLPPGTGDVQLSLAQTLQLDGALVITSPQKAAFEVAFRAAGLFPKVEVPILGVVETMSFLPENPKGLPSIFGEGGGALVAEKLKVPLLGKIPLDATLRESCDAGRPLVCEAPEAFSSQCFLKLAQKIVETLKP